MSDQLDNSMLQRALRLARRGAGLSLPNPQVGAVITSPDGTILGQGFHQKAGEGHAEVNALADTTRRGNSPRGATLYVTLEPCCSFGRTPPCTQAISKAGIARVVIGCVDANPKHAGHAFEILRQQGIQVELASPKIQQECLQLNEAFFWRIQHGRPFVCLKMAATMDGKIALPDGSSQWITGTAARNYVQKLRQLAGAIMVGGRTARLDNPSLTVRTPLHCRQQPRPYVWSSQPLPPDLTLAQRQAEVVHPQSQEEWLEFLRSLGQQECNLLLLEGGGELAASALHAGIVNRLDLFLAPKLMLGRDSVPVTGGQAVPSLDQAISLSRLQTRKIGQDLLCIGYCDNVYRFD